MILLVESIKLIVRLDKWLMLRQTKRTCKMIKKQELFKLFLVVQKLKNELQSAVWEIECK